MGREEYEGFLPYRAALGIVYVMDLVEYDPVMVLEVIGTIEYLVPEYIRSHYQYRRALIYRDVAGQYSDVVAVPAAEVAELLVGEGLYGGRVYHALVLADALFDDVLRDSGLARACRRAGYS